MLLQLVALAPEDGWAFLRREAELVLVRPPYHAGNVTPISNDVLEKAIQHHGFQNEDRVFPDWGSLISFLKRQIVEARQARGGGVPDSETIRDLVHFAPSSILVGYLDRIEAELLPNREWRAAQSLLTELLRTEAVKADPELYDRTVRLLGRCQPRPVSLSLDSVEALAKQFPGTARRYNATAVRDYARAVAKRGQVLAICG